MCPVLLDHYTKTKAFIRDSNKLKLSDKHFTKFIEALYCLSKSEALPPEFQDHQLCGDWSDLAVIANCLTDVTQASNRMGAVATH